MRCTELKRKILGSERVGRKCHEGRVKRVRRRYKEVGPLRDKQRGE